jgi:flagellar basal body-associated protein FliL
MKEKTKSNKIILVIIFSVIFFIAGGVAGYFFGVSQHPNFNRNNFTQIDDAAKAQVTSVFESAKTIDDINTYCDTTANKFACMYYCRTISPQNQFCSQINLSYGTPKQ